jgi:hypothetical protein
LIRVARSAIASLYGLDSITDYDEHRHTLEHLFDNNTYMLRAVDRSLPADVRYLHLSSHGLCLADSVLSQPSASPQLRLFRYATSPAMSLLSLTVVSHSLTFDCAALGAAFAVPGVASGSGVLGKWLLFGSGLVVSICRFYMLYLVYLDCLPMLLSVPASCHCDRCFCHSPDAVRSTYTSVRLERLLHLPLRSYTCARCMFAYASRMRCMQPVYRRSFHTMTFGAYRAFQAWARSTRAVRNHFFLLMVCSHFMVATMLRVW